jgi:agmatinase
MPYPPTFMGVPMSTSEARGGVTVLGAPFDCGPSLYRSGPHLAPGAIRAASRQLLRARVDTDRDPLLELDVRDGGDVEVSLSDRDASLLAIQAAVAELLRTGSVPLVLGGDGSIALAVMRALRQQVEGCAVLHFDAHTDSNPPQPGRATAATAFWLAHAEKLVDVDASVHIGLRGPTLAANSARLARELGYHTFTMDRLLEEGFAACLDRIRRTVADRAVYVCWDMDVFDPSVAPGVFAPSWGGFTAAQGLWIARMLAGLRIVAIEINTVSPPHDIGDLTSSLAAQLAFELLFAVPARSNGKHDTLVRRHG